MRGDKVVVRGFQQIPYFVRVWRDLGAVVEVLSDEDFQKWQVGRMVGIPIGFRRRDVFRFEDLPAEPIDWQAMTIYTS